ncbi:apolipoprotein N-acyltransferase, partial [Candidatus Omnitrophota bacterium]
MLIVPKAMFKSVLFSILSAILLILSFPKPDLGFLAWIAFVPWLFALKQKRLKDAFLLSYLVGIIYFSGVIYWINHVSSLGFSILVLYLGLYFALFGLIVSVFSRKSSVFSLLVIPCAWVTLEYVRSHLFSGFGWALLGYSQYRYLPIIQISDLTGAYGVSFLIVLVSCGIWQLIHALQNKFSIKKIILIVVCILFPVLLAWGYGYYHSRIAIPGQVIKIAVVQGNIPQRLKWDPEAKEDILEIYTALTRKAAADHPQIIIWPETSVPGYLTEDRELLERISLLSQEIAPAYLLVGTPHVGEERKVYNSATLLLKGNIIQRYDKLHLVPFGEFIPGQRFFSRFSFAELIGNFSPGEDYTVFTLFRTVPMTKIGALICFEDVFSYLGRGFSKKGVEILVNMTNDAWFFDSSEPTQHLQASVFRAVENRVNVVRSANTGISCFINRWGKIEAGVTDASGKDVLVA